MNFATLYARALIRRDALLDELHVSTDDVHAGIYLEDAGYMVRIARKSDGVILAHELVAEESAS